ncbi:MAG: DUF3987 domain-containing protein [Tannerellaceae bacterium]|jgi:hypothetical protein|nr:DUF3987 domain-containing protein [Tannerellaceae bacterium]
MEEKLITPEGIINKAIDLNMSFAGAEFPVGIFPAKIQRIIHEVYECQSYPIDYTAASILTAIAVGIGNTHLIQMKQGWVESAILFVALVGRPGANKSHPLSFAMKPFIDFDYRQNLEFGKLYAKYEQDISMSKKERQDAGAEEFPQEPIRKRFLASDITPEGLSYIHAQNKRGLCLWSDELSAWFKNFNRYNNGSEEQFWLSVFSAKTVISDRKHAKSSVFITRPFIPVIGTIQKNILSDLAKGDRSSNGFIDRILFVMPPVQRKTRWSNKEISGNLELEWHTLMNKLISLECSLDENNEIQPSIITFSEAARKQLYRWQHQHAELCDGIGNEILLGIYCKLEIYIIRFCLVIQITRWLCGECEKEQIDTESVQKAILLTEYFKQTATRVQNLMNETALTSQQQSIFFQLPELFTTAQGVDIAAGQGMKERAFKEFLSKNIGTLFQKDRHGEYRKV